MKNKNFKITKEIVIISIIIVASVLAILIKTLGEADTTTKPPTLKEIEKEEKPKQEPEQAREEENYPTDPEERAQSQAALDIEYAKQVEEFFRKYPMFGFLPIETGEYTIVYSIEQEKYRIRIKKPEKELSEQQEQRIIKEALQNIKDKGEVGEIQYYVLYEEIEEFN